MISVKKGKLLPGHLQDRLAAAGIALLLGSISGLACVAVRLVFRLLQWLLTRQSASLPDAALSLSPIRRLLTPVVGAAIATGILWATRRWSRAERFTEYVAAVQLREGRIPFASTLWRTTSSAFSIATGAAIGREGSMIQFSAAVTSWIGVRFPTRSLSLSRKVACGVAAAIAAVYQAPLAGVFFGLEIVLGNRGWTELPNLAIASVSGWFISRTLLSPGPLFAIPGHLALSLGALWSLPLAVLIGVAAPAYQQLVRSLRFIARWPLALLWSGLAVGLLGLRFASVWGNGDVALLQVLHQSRPLSTVAVILAVRLAATAICVGAGTIGGVFTPTLFAGGAIGLLCGQLLHLSQPVLMAVVGLSVLMAAATHAPIMAALMAAELTGQWHLLPALLLLNLLAHQVARSISPQSLYAIATPDPAK